jgi:hypothetical protein
MTTLPGLGRQRPGRPENRGWRDLGWVAWRQHRTGFCVAIAALAVTAVIVGVTGADLHRTWSWPRSGQTLGELALLLLLIPLLAGVFLGAPLLAGQATSGTMRFVWTQGISVRRWLLAQVIPAAVILVLAGAGLGLLFRWSAALDLTDRPEWNGGLFPLSPLPFAGWLVFGFALGTALGGLIRKVVPAMAATVAGYLATLVGAATWRTHYLPPLSVSFRVADSSAWQRALASGVPGTAARLSQWLGWPDGRRLSVADLSKPTGWLTAHHIKVWIAYQPASRFGTFELIEFGWLIAASAALLAAALVLVSHPATLPSLRGMIRLPVMTRPTLPAAFRSPPGRASRAWAAWRPHRLTILIMLAGFAVSAIFLGVTGLRTRLTYDRYRSDGCIVHYLTTHCWHLLGQMNDITWVVSLLPWILGVFIGAPLIAGEFETGSHIFAMTQGVSRRRQVTATLLLLGGIVVVGSCLLAILAIWSKNPWHLVATGSDAGISYWSAGYFGITPVVLPAGALLDFCVGVALGALIRRTVPAMAATAISVLAITWLTTGFGVTNHGDATYGRLAAALLRIDTATTRVTATMRAQPTGWEGPVVMVGDGRAIRIAEDYNQTWPPGQGHQEAEATYYYPAGRFGPRDAVWVAGWFAGPGGHLSARATQQMFDRLPHRTFAPSAQPMTWFDHWLAGRGFSYRIAYQPASHYWPIQALLAAILLTLAVLTGCVTILLSQRSGSQAARKHRQPAIT